MKSKERVAIGFSNIEEMQLYQDVCLGRDKTLIDIDHKQIKYEIITKKGCIQIINDFALNDAFQEVKNMTRLDRLVYLYNYNYNIINICKGLNEAVGASVNELYAVDEVLEGRNMFEKKLTINQYKRLATNACFEIFDIAMEELDKNDKKSFIEMIEGIKEIKNKKR